MSDFYFTQLEEGEEMVFGVITSTRSTSVSVGDAQVSGQTSERRLGITNRRVIQTEGLLNKHVIDSSLEKVNDVVLSQSAFGRMLGYGDVEILTASEMGVNRFERITGPLRFKTEMLNQKEDLGRLGEFSRKAERVLESAPPSAGDIPELIAELDELRQKGIISQQDFEEKKQELLRKI